MFPGGMLGAARKLKRYGVELKGAGGGIDTAGGNIGGTAASGSVIRFDVLAYQFDELSLAIGGKGVAGSRNPFDPVNSPLQFSNAGLRPGGLGGPLNSSNPSGGGGQGGGSTGAWLYGELLGGAAGGPGAGGGSQNRDGGNAGEFGANPVAGPTDGSGQIGAVPSGNNGGTGGGGGGGGGVDADHLGGKGGDAGTDNGSRSGGGKSGASWTNPARTLTFRAFSDQVGYPAFLKRFRHSSGLYRSMMGPMALQSSSRVRSASLRSSALSFAKACSMGLRSGL